MSATPLLPFRETTLREEQERIRRDRLEGTTCRACASHCQLYRRKLTSSMAAALCILAREPGEWLHLPTVLAADTLPAHLRSTLRGDPAKLRYWGLLQEADAEREDGNPHAGLWRVTGSGKDFARGLIKVPAIALVYQGGLEGFDGPQITVREALGQRFDWTELVKGWGR